MDQPLVACIFATAERSPDSPALFINKTKISYVVLRRRIQAAASFMREAGVKKGDRVVLAALSTPGFVYGYFATHLLGAVAVPVGPRSAEASLAAIIEKAEPSIIFLTNSDICNRRQCRPIDVLENAPAQDAAFDFPTMDSVADILFTSGTTGKPKGIVLSHANIRAAAVNINSFIGNTSEDRELVPLPLNHSFGLGRLRCNMLAGGGVILTEGFLFVNRLFDALTDWKATGLSFVPAGLALLLKLSGNKLGEFSEQLKYVEIGSAPMTLEHKRRLMQMLPNSRLCMHFGLSEASRSAFIEFHQAKKRLTSIGTATPNVRIKVIDERGDELPAGVHGELVVAAQTVMQGYWRDPGLTSNAFIGKWLKTGDIGYRDEEGYLYLTGRKSDFINVAGVKVSPEEIEAKLREIGGIGDCCVIGIPDPVNLSGEAVKAFLVADKMKGDAPSERTIINVLRGQLEAYKIPAIYQWIGEIPRTESGKIQRSKLDSATDEKL